MASRPKRTIAWRLRKSQRFEIDAYRKGEKTIYRFFAQCLH